jgi:hypothetical protein
MALFFANSLTDDDDIIECGEVDYQYTPAKDMADMDDEVADMPEHLPPPAPKPLKRELANEGIDGMRWSFSSGSFFFKNISFHILNAACSESHRLTSNIYFPNTHTHTHTHTNTHTQPAQIPPPSSTFMHKIYG